MFRREMKANFKNFLIWLLIIIGLFLVVFLIYPSIMSSGNIEMINEMMKGFPEELLKAFNMDISNISTVFGWLKTEGFVFVVLLAGMYSAILASQVLVKEESEKTIEYLNSLPVTRKQIVISKVLASLSYITLLVVLILIFNFCGLLISGDFDKKLFLMLSITPLFSSYVIFGLCLFLSTFTHKAKKMIGVSLGIVFISYIIQILSTLGSKVEFLKYFSIFSFADTRNIILNSEINPVLVVISVILTIGLIALTIIRYNKKELV